MGFGLRASCHPSWHQAQPKQQAYTYGRADRHARLSAVNRQVGLPLLYPNSHFPDGTNGHISKAKLEQH